MFSEFWQASILEVYAAMAGPTGGILREDGSRFIDRSKQRLANAEERLIAGPPRGIDPMPTRKTCLFLGATSRSDRWGLPDAAMLWGTEIADAMPNRVVRVTMDRIAPFENAIFPYDAILSIWLAHGATKFRPETPPDDIAVGATALVESCETPPDVLAAAYDRGAVRSAS